jgi:CheY-like chemotaxis protein
LPQAFVPQKTGRRVVASSSAVAAAAGSTRLASGAAIDFGPLTPADVDGISPASTAADDSGDVQSGDRVILIVDNDRGFAEFALETARKAGFKGLVTPSGVAALALARDFQPCAILLDISLPDIDGWRVLQRLKRDLSIRHIPVFVVSTVDNPEFGMTLGARGVLRKPIQTAGVLEDFLNGVRQFVDRDLRRVLVIESDAARRAKIKETLACLHVDVVTADSGAAAIEAFAADPADCVIFTPDPSDMRLAVLAEQIQSRAPACEPSLLLYVDESAPIEGRQHLAHLAKEFNLHLIESPGALLDQAAIALCKPVGSLPENEQRLLRDQSSDPAILAGKKVLIVDDDIRNIFALTSVLERFDMVSVSAETGRDAINLLQASPDVDVVLMDIMMPEMDGIDTMKAIRRISRFKKLPIVAVTAKAMKGDREKCFEAGAWDYLSKPVDPDQMLASLRAWLAT